MTDDVPGATTLIKAEVEAKNELLKLVYAELRDLAGLQMAMERGDHTLTPTALVHEAWLRITKDGTPAQWNSRSEFLMTAAEAMRRILVEHARRHRRRKSVVRNEVFPAALVSQWRPSEHLDLIVVDELITQLAGLHPEKANLVKLKFFGGLSMPEVAEALGVSLATANRHWAYARAWLSRAMMEQEEP